jgi:hypothetical protein
VKLDAETLRKLALSGARNEKRELEVRLERVNEIIRQLTGAAVPADGRKKSVADKMKPKGRRKRREHTEAFKAKVVKEAREADNASAIGKKYDVTPTLVRTWMEKAK